MPRARTTNLYTETAAASQDQGGGCSFGFAIVPPLAVIIISALLASFALKTTPLESPPAASGISPVFTAEVQHWGENITQWAAASQLDPNLAATVMQIESCGDPRATSTSGAMGLFQVMRFHFYAVDNP